jgi:malate synthase
MTALEIRGRLERTYQDVLTREALDALEALAPLDADRKAVMAARINRRLARARNRERITFPDPQSVIPRTRSRSPTRAGRFVGSDIPGRSSSSVDPGHRLRAPNASTDVSIRNVAYALLSGADGWMFDGETHWASCPRCRWTTSGTSSWPSTAIRCS